MVNVLIIEDNEALAFTMQEQLASEGYALEIVPTGAEALARLEGGGVHGILLDLNLPDMHGFDILKEISAKEYHCAIVVVTGETSMNVAIEAMQLGAHDFVPKPTSPERLHVSLKNALERSELKVIADTFKKMSRDSFHGLVGKSAKMQAVYTVIENVAPSRASVFITGESGTGKELVARAIHELSPRASKPFEVLNCAAIPHDLLESEIFGHVKGAFTGAISDKKGVASRADGGTLFLDELGEMPIGLQSKLLRFIQSGTFMSVGGGQEQGVDIRFICATNRDPIGAIKEGFLREDLYYRLNVVPIDLAPLRERGADILLLARHFLTKAAQEEGKAFKGFSKEVEDLFLGYRWSGNVRELENAVRRVVVLNDGDLVQLGMLNALNQQAEVNLERLSVDSRAVDSFLPRRAADVKSLKFYEKEVITAALAACQGNITEASRRLGVNPATIHRKQKQWQNDQI